MGAAPQGGDDIEKATIVAGKGSRAPSHLQQMPGVGQAGAADGHVGVDGRHVLGVQRAQREGNDAAPVAACSGTRRHSSGSRAPHLSAVTPRHAAQGPDDGGTRPRSGNPTTTTDLACTSIFTGADLTHAFLAHGLQLPDVCTSCAEKTQCKSPRRPGVYVSAVGWTEPKIGTWRPHPARHSARTPAAAWPRSWWPPSGGCRSPGVWAPS